MLRIRRIRCGSAGRPLGHFLSTGLQPKLQTETQQRAKLHRKRGAGKQALPGIAKSRERQAERAIERSSQARSLRVTEVYGEGRQAGTRNGPTCLGSTALKQGRAVLHLAFRLFIGLALIFLFLFFAALFLTLIFILLAAFVAHGRAPFLKD